MTEETIQIPEDENTVVPRSELRFMRVELSKLRELVDQQRALLAGPELTAHYSPRYVRTHVTVEWPNPDVHQCLVSRELIESVAEALDERETQYFYYAKKEARDLEYAFCADKLYLAVDREELDRVINRMKKDGTYSDYVFYAVKPYKTIEMTEEKTQ